MSWVRDHLGLILELTLRHTVLAGIPLLLGLVLGPALFAQKQLTNQEIWYSPSFSSEGVAGLNSMNDGVRYTTLEEEGGAPVVNIYDYRTGNKLSTLFSGKDLLLPGAKDPIYMDDYHLSGDEQRVMIETGTEHLYRYSYYAYNFIYDLKNKSLRPLADTTKHKQRLATFSPDGTHAAFVRDIDHDNDAAAIARAIVDMAHSLGKSVIAEGVETDAQRERLRSLGCESAQGFLWSPALPASDLGQRFLARGAAVEASV